MSEKFMQNSFLQDNHGRIFPQFTSKKEPERENKSLLSTAPLITKPTHKDVHNDKAYYVKKSNSLHLTVKQDLFFCLGNGKSAVRALSRRIQISMLTARGLRE